MARKKMAGKKMAGENGGKENHYRNPVLCRLPWWTAKAGTADGKALWRLQRTANSDGKDRVGKQVLCRLLFMADGKEPFAYSGGRQRGGTAKILDVRQC